MRRLLMAVALLLGSLAPLATGVLPVSADSCTGNSGWPWYQWTRTDNQVYGVRAPLQVRLDGGLCGVPGGGQDPVSTVWIAIVQPPDIVQIGLIHDFGMNGGHWCRVWANGTGGNRTDYDCSDSNDAYVWFSIDRYYDASHNAYKYEIDDCGISGGYGANCSPENSSQPAFGTPAGQTASEADYTCVIHIMGSSGDKQNLGTSNYPLEGTTDGATWFTRSWGGPHWNNSDDSCGVDGYYGTDSGTDGMRFWDSRNSG